ncbi:hypothetical protein [Streptomyces parvus]|uniref:hypothetical protein n=1 Tax=Streptomyces parvus TaxID=66428 RepID=UPI00331B27B8
MDTLCEVCRGHAPADHYLCAACQHSALAWLREIPHQVTLVRTMLQPENGPARRGGAGRAHAPLPVRLEVLDLIGPGHAHVVPDPHGDQTGGVPVGPFLAGWAHYIASDVPAVHRDEHGTIQVVQARAATAWAATAWPRTGTGLTAWCTWHERYLPYTATRPYAAHFHHELEGMVHRLRRLNHTKAVIRAKDAPCPDCSGWSLVEHEDQLYISCTLCPARLTPEQYDAHRAAVMPALASLALRIAATQQTAA